MERRLIDQTEFQQTYWRLEFMRSSAYKTAGHAQLRKRFLRQTDGEPRRISTYRMFRSSEFRELCEFYLEGIGIRRFDQFMEFAKQLEETFIHTAK
jgi:hypothetical protein